MENSPEIPSGEPTHEIPSELPAVVVLGAGLREEPTKGAPEPYRLDKWSKMRVLAAGMMFEEGLAGQIILTGGKLFGEERPSVAKAMKEYLFFKSCDEKGKPRITEDSIILEEESFDTSGDAEEVVKILQERRIPGAIILTNEPHLARAEKLFKNYGAEVHSGIAAEAKIKERSEKHARLVQRQAHSLDNLKFWGREFVLRGLLYFDPEGKIIRKLAQKRRPKNKKEE